MSKRTQALLLFVCLNLLLFVPGFGSGRWILSLSNTLLLLILLSVSLIVSLVFDENRTYSLLFITTSVLAIIFFNKQAIESWNDDMRYLARLYANNLCAAHLPVDSVYKKAVTGFDQCKRDYSYLKLRRKMENAVRGRFDYIVEDTINKTKFWVTIYAPFSDPIVYIYDYTGSEQLLDE